jgi:hypothetical protein
MAAIEERIEWRFRAEYRLIVPAAITFFQLGALSPQSHFEKQSVSLCRHATIIYY